MCKIRLKKIPSVDFLFTQPNQKWSGINCIKHVFRCGDCITMHLQILVESEQLLWTRCVWTEWHGSGEKIVIVYKSDSLFTWNTLNDRKGERERERNWEKEKRRKKIGQSCGRVWERANLNTAHTNKTHKYAVLRLCCSCEKMKWREKNVRNQTKRKQMWAT